MSVAGISDGENPAASRRRMWMALGALAALAILAWFTIDGSAVMPVREYRVWGVGFGGFGVKIRLVPELVLGLFAVRVVTANMRARLESDNRK
ncbi:MAG TPA: hypothetical protein VME68_16335 [Acidobacteriaceae bacterium]|nr:hypothetical protein [Acidobacteriaceae bacterium]